MNPSREVVSHGQFVFDDGTGRVVVMVRGPGEATPYGVHAALDRAKLEALMALLCAAKPASLP